jgi:hypothetical protein
MAASFHELEAAMKRMFVLILIFAAFLLQGCGTLGYKEFYTQTAPTKYPPTQKVTEFEYANVDLKEIYDLLYSDFLVIGRSSFNGPYENPTQSVSFAKSIGADVFLSTAQFKETRTSFMSLSSPTVHTTYANGYSGTGSYGGKATTYGTSTTIVPLSVDRYDQVGLYLRNVNGVVPLWKRTQAQYKKTAPSDIEGAWHDENYKLILYRSGEQCVAFVSAEPKEKEAWHQGQLKFVYGVDSGVGVYLMGDKTPMPARFKLNKFGHLEVTIIAADQTVSFAR